MRFTKLEQLTDRCTVVDRRVARQAVAKAEAAERRLAEPDSREALEQFEAAEELYCLAKLSQRKARRALQRAEVRHGVFAFLFSWLAAGKNTHRSVH